VNITKNLLSPLLSEMTTKIIVLAEVRDMPTGNIDHGFTATYNIVLATLLDPNVKKYNYSTEQ